MNQAEVEAFVTRLENVERSENFGYTFFFVGDDHRLPFVTLANELDFPIQPLTHTLTRFYLFILPLLQ